MTGSIRKNMESWFGDFAAGEVIQSQWGDDVNATLDDAISLSSNNLGTTGNLSFSTTNDEITRASGSWITDVVTIGTKIRITGSVSNDGVYTISSIQSATVIRVTEDLTTESAVAATAELYQNLNSGLMVNNGVFVTKWDGDNTPITRYWSCNAHKVLPTLLDHETQIGVWDHLNSTGAQSLAAGDTVISVHLPHGAIVTRFSCWGYENASAVLEMYLRATAHNTVGTIQLATLNFTTTQEEVFVTTISNDTIDNNANGYYIHFNVITQGSGAVVRGVQIDYTVVVSQP